MNDFEPTLTRTANPDQHEQTRLAMPSVLIVEDDPDIRDVLANLLETRGYRAVLAANGREALTLLRGGERFRAILLDLMMPGMDGWQFRAEQQADEELSEIPVILMTASSRADGMPADVVLVQKPFNGDDVVAALQAVTPAS